MAIPKGLNVLRDVREYVHAEIDQVYGDICALEAKLAERRAHLATLNAVREAAGLPARASAPGEIAAPRMPSMPSRIARILP
jgi:hypothetical protein